MWDFFVCFAAIMILVCEGSGKLKLSDAFNCVNPLWLEQLGSEDPKC